MIYQRFEGGGRAPSRRAVLKCMAFHKFNILVFLPVTIEKKFLSTLISSDRFSYVSYVSNV